MKYTIKMILVMTTLISMAGNSQADSSTIEPIVTGTFLQQEPINKSPSFTMSFILKAILPLVLIQ